MSRTVLGMSISLLLAAPPPVSHPTFLNYYLPLLIMYAKLIYLSYVRPFGNDPDYEVLAMTSLMYMGTEAPGSTQPYILGSTCVTTCHATYKSPS